MKRFANPTERPKAPPSLQVELVPTDLITIVNEDVLANVRLELQSVLDRGRYPSREAWARAVLDNAEPVELYENDGRLELLDGNHRYLAATILRRPLPAIVIPKRRYYEDLPLEERQHHARLWRESIARLRNLDYSFRAEFDGEPVIVLGRSRDFEPYKSHPMNTPSGEATDEQMMVQHVGASRSWPSSEIDKKFITFAHSIYVNGQRLVHHPEDAQGKPYSRRPKHFLLPGENPISRPAKTALLVAAGVAAGAAVLYVVTRPMKSPLVTQGSRVALIGDSLAVGLGPELAKLAAASNVVLKTEAFSGTTPLQWATHAKACGQCGDWLAGFQPQVVLIVLGTNDLGYVTPPANYYEAIRDKIYALGAKVVWVEPPTMGRSTLAAVRKVIEGLGVNVVPEASVPISGDKVHPTSLGFNVWAQSIWRYLTIAS